MPWPKIVLILSIFELCQESIVAFFQTKVVFSVKKIYLNILLGVLNQLYVHHVA
jgi:hypothetical protein